MSRMWRVVLLIIVLAGAVLAAVAAGRARPRPVALALDTRRDLYLLDTGTGRTLPIQSRGQLVDTPFENGLQQGSSDCNDPPNAADRWCVLRRNLIGELSVYHPNTQQTAHVAKSTHNFTIAWASGPAGNQLLYDMPRDNAADINVYHVERDATRTLITLSAGYRLVPSPDGRWLLLPTTDGDLFLFDLVNGGDPLNFADRLPAGQSINTIVGYGSAMWAEDSQTVFMQAGQRESTLYRIDLLDGQPRPVVTVPGAAIFDFDVSANGAWVAFIAGRDSDLNIYVVPADGSRPARVVRPLGALRQIVFTGASAPQAN